MKAAVTTGLMVLTRIAAGMTAGIAACMPMQAAHAQHAAVQQADSTADSRAAALVAQMTLAEKISLLHGHYPNAMEFRPEGVQPSAGYVPGIPRLNIPAQRMTNGAAGVDAAGQYDNQATALPSSLGIAASFDPRVAHAVGRVVGAESRAKGFNILLAGTMNLTREPRSGRNFENLGEDALLTGIMGGAAIAGAQRSGVVTTAKHFALNTQETGRMVLDARMDEAALRESDLLAFQKAIEIGNPGAVMAAYNRVNGDYASENAALIDILKQDWGYQGWVMSDWGATHSTVKSANAGLDQQMGEELDKYVWFGALLADAVASGLVPQAVVDDKARRILRSLIAHGAVDDPVQQGGQPDLISGAAIAREAAARSITLLKNTEGLLPLSANVRSIAVIGGHANDGVMSGGGSSQVKPLGTLPLPAPGKPSPLTSTMFLHPSRPLDAIAAAAPQAQVSYVRGVDIASTAAAAGAADVAVVFATQFTSEFVDVPLSLDGNQDALIAAVARANPNTIVVLETGGPVLMPWLDGVGAVLEAWYPGIGGGEAIADVLVGNVNPSGRLPITFPASAAQLPNPVLPGSLLPAPADDASTQPEPFTMTYPEGADAGYRWYAIQGAEPLFPFGHGLSYSKFVHLSLNFDAASLTADFSLANVGDRAGTDTPQLYLTPPGGTPRLIGWAKAELAPGENKRFSITIDPRFASRFDVANKQWVMAGGTYSLRLAASATDSGTVARATLPARRFDVGWTPKNALAPVATGD